MPGLLIVNADDWGADRACTDRIEESFTAAAITSATAMVWMADSERAAQLARERAHPIGLHLNLTQPYDAPAVPERERQRQRAIASTLGRRSARALCSPALLRTVRASVAAQLERFETLYGGPPTHIDGHNHAHLRAVVLFALPPGAKVRTAHTWEGNSGSRGRALRHRVISTRYRSTDSCFCLSNVHPELGHGGLESVLQSAHNSTVEIVVHPHRVDEQRLLMAPGWRDALHGLRLGSFRDL